jgi:hypothetical protein
MSDGTYRIWCLLEGESALFSVTALPTISIYELKNLIKKEKTQAINVDANYLTLWKVRMTMAVIRSDITRDTTLAYTGYPRQAS